MKNVCVALSVAVVSICVGAALEVRAQAFPTKTVTIVSPYPPGGPTSDTARLLADGLSKRLGQPVIVENVGGAGGNIGVGRVARAAPDGYSLLVHNMAIASSVSLFPALPFDTVNDLTGIGLVNTSPLVIIGRKSLPAGNLAELIRWMKETPVVKFAQAGTGNMAHLCGALFAQTIGVKVDMIPYRGGGPALQDVIGEHVDLYCSVAPAAVSAIQSGAVKAFGVSARQTYQPLPQVPTLASLGMPNLTIEYWHGMWAPARTPQPVVEKINAALRQVLADPATRAIWDRIGILVYPREGQTPEATDAHLRSEIKFWEKVIRDNDIKAGP